MTVKTKLRTTTKVLGGILIILIGLFATLEWLSGYEMYECDAKGYSLYVVKKELQRDGPLVFGTLDTGARVAVGRYALEACRVW